MQNLTKIITSPETLFKMKKATTLFLSALFIISLLSSCARGSGCFYNNVEGDISVSQEQAKNSASKFVKAYKKAE